MNILNEDFADYIDELHEYAQKRGFTNSLVEFCVEALKRSVNGGDGALWSDSVLSVHLERGGTRLATAMSMMVGARGAILADVSFTKTLFTQDLIIHPRFQRGLDEVLQKYHRNTGNTIDENKLAELELRTAIEDYGDRHSPLIGFIDDILVPLFEPGPHDKTSCQFNAQRDRFEDRIKRAFTLALLTKIHPFDIYDNNSQTFNNAFSLANKYDKHYIKPLRKFLFYTRDACHISQNILSDHIIDQIVYRWKQYLFIEVCDEAFEDYDNYDQSDREVHYDNSGFYAALQLLRKEAPLAFILDRLESEYDESFKSANWDHNEALLIYLTNKQIKVQPADFLGIQAVSFATQSDSESIRASCGIIKPNPIWNDTIIDRLEHLINSRDVKEEALQVFFEMYPDFILDDLHISSLPQVILYNESGPNLRPDFIVKRVEGCTVDIVEIKRPVRNLVSGRASRPKVAGQLADGISQLKEYSRWFRIPQNRDWFKGRYNLDGYEPKLTLIIGRNTGFRSHEVRSHVLEGHGVHIITYDELLEMSRIRKSRAIGLNQ